MPQIFKDLEALSQAAAEMFAAQAVETAALGGQFSAALSGGQTPHRMYTLLSEPPLRERVPWEAVHIFWGDERCVPSTDPRSNALMARKALLNRVPIPPLQIHIAACLPAPREAAEQYETEIRDYFGKEPPYFDLILLGLGENAHTASLFPNTPVLDDVKRWVADVYVAEQDMYRLTFTAPLINQAKMVVFLVSGEAKADALSAVLEGEFQSHKYPAQLIRPVQGKVVWLVDQAAASKLTPKI